MAQHATLRYARRSVLMGNALRALHPIAAQGLNSHVLDAHMLANTLVHARNKCEDFSSGKVLSAWSERSQKQGEFVETMTRLLGHAVIDSRYAFGHRLGLLGLSLCPSVRAKIVRLGLVKEWIHAF